MLCGRRGAVHLGAGGLGELDSRDTDTAGRGVHQHPLSGAQRPVTVQRGPRGRIVDGDRGALFEAQRIGKGHGIVRRNVDDFGVATESRAGQHPLPDTVWLDAFANGLDRSGDFVADDRRKFRRVWVHADAGKVVGEIHARGAYRNPQLARAGRRWVGPLLDLQDRRVAVLGDDDYAHRVPSNRVMAVLRPRLGGGERYRASQDPCD